MASATADATSQPSNYWDGPAYGPSVKARRLYRKDERAAGLKGPALQHAMQAWNQQQNQTGEQQAQQDLTATGLDPNSPLDRGINARKFMQNLRSGKGPAFKRLQLLQAASAPYRQNQSQIEAEQRAQLAAGSPVAGVGPGTNPTADIANENALLGHLEDYAQQNLGVGLTPKQLSAYRATMRAPLEAQYAGQTQAAGQAAAGRGIDPSSPMAGAQSMELERAREQGLSGVEQQLTLEDLNQQNFNEQQAQQASQQVGQEREFDVNARLRRLAEVESGMRDLSQMSEGERQYDTSYTESQRQANLARRMWAQYAQSLDPSTLEQVAGGLGGFFQGLGV